MSRESRAEELLDHAQRLIQERGFNAFSYKDLANLVGIRTASIHYHFNSKAELGHRVLERYTEALRRSLVELESRPSAEERLRGFIGSYRYTQAAGAICLCGSMASDVGTLDARTQELVDTYLQVSEDWVAKTVIHGVESGEFAERLSPADVAASLVAALQGALIVGRASGGRPLLDAVERRFFSGLLL